MIKGESNTAVIETGKMALQAVVEEQSVRLIIAQSHVA